MAMQGRKWDRVREDHDGRATSGADVPPPARLRHRQRSFGSPSALTPYTTALAWTTASRPTPSGRITSGASIRTITSSAAGAGYDDYLIEANLLRTQGRRYGELLPATPRRDASSTWAPPRASCSGPRSGLDHDGARAQRPDGGPCPRRARARYPAGQPRNPPDRPPFDAVCLIQVSGISSTSAARSPASPGSHARRPLPNRILAPRILAARLMGRGWHEYSPPSVVHWFTRDSLDTAMRRHGFSPIGGRAEEIHLGRPRPLAPRTQAPGTTSRPGARRTDGAHPAQGEFPLPRIRCGMAPLPQGRRPAPGDRP